MKRATTEHTVLLPAFQIKHHFESAKAAVNGVSRGSEEIR